MAVDYTIPTNDLRSCFYMREVERHYRYYGSYPEYFICDLIRCDYCGGHFSEKNMYRFFPAYTWQRQVGQRRWMKKFGDNKCNLCQQRDYFRALAKSKIFKETGLFSNQQPEEVVIKVAQYLAERRVAIEVKRLIRQIKSTIKTKKREKYNAPERIII